MIPNHIAATLTHCRNGQPLVVLESEPFNGAEARPADLYRMAVYLIAIAEAANRTSFTGKHFAPTRITLGAAA